VKDREEGGTARRTALLPGLTKGASGAEFPKMPDSISEGGRENTVAGGFSGSGWRRWFMGWRRFGVQSVSSDRVWQFTAWMRSRIKGLGSWEESGEWCLRRWWPALRVGAED